MSAVVCAPQCAITGSGPPTEAVERGLPLGEGEQDSLAGRAEQQDAVDAAGAEEREVRRERVEIERRAVVAQRRQCGGNRLRAHAAIVVRR